MAELPLNQHIHTPQLANSVATGSFREPPAPFSAAELVSAGRCAELIRGVHEGRSRGKLWEIDLLWIAVVVFLAWFRLQSGYGASRMFSLPEAISLAACGVLIFSLKLQRRFRYNRAMAGLLDDNHKHNLPVLIELIPHVRGKQCGAAKARLTRLLLSIEPDDRILTRNDFIRLHAVLRWPDVALVCAVLHAIENVGSLESLPVVTRLAKGKYLARHVRAVKETAISCMDALKDQMTEKRSIGLMLGLMGRGDIYPHLRYEARRSMIVMFPRLTAEDRHHFKREERRLLYACLETRDVEFILAVLKMLPRVGLLDALPYVSALAAGKHAANRKIPTLKEHARVCQALLGGRLKVLDSSNVLLRPSVAGSATRDDLVRTLRGSSHSDPAELVRPTLTANRK